ncbi:MAG TPA: DUF6588 family protein [Chryseolinea sp.]|nr:DUF6588 family protein [Chryseolinea sp.]
MKRLLLCIMVFATICAQAQDENDIVNFLAAGKNDASKLMRAYLTPAIEGLSYGFNGGWYTTAKAHKTFGFDIGISFNAVFVPTSKNYFNPNGLQLETVTGFTSTAPNGQAPTILGPDDKTTYSVDADDNGVPDATFQGPRGLDFKDNIKINGVLAPTAQVGLGIYKNTDLKIRWMPEVEYGSTKVKLLGFGVMHDIKQHIRGIKVLPFDLSVLVAFTSIKGSTALAGTFSPGGDTRPQIMDYDMDAWLFEALISKKLAMFTFYGGFGYNTIKAKSDVTGSYVVPGYPTAFKDPISLNFKNNSMRLNAGMRISLGPVYINGEYILQEYSTLSVGLGVTVR